MSSFYSNQPKALPASQPGNPYRPDIDGLRALAVISVIVNHIDSNLLPSGYLGVDVFFVISGYVITQSLLSKTQETLGNLLMDFYARRVQRIAPALLACVCLTGVLIALVSTDNILSLQTGIASLFGVSNLKLWANSSDYFAPASALNPFLHTWSLGVEEQFYLLFPFLLWASVLGAGRAQQPPSPALLGMLALASLGMYLFLNQTHTNAAFYWMPARFWELAAGALLIVVRPHVGSYSPAPNERTIALYALVSLAAVATFWPEHWSASGVIIVVILTMLILATSRRKTLGHALLTLPPMIYVGQISYSLYLYHWSVLSIGRQTIGIRWFSVPFLVGLMFALAVLSYRYVEQPLRVARWSRVRWGTIGYGLIASALAAALLGILMDSSVFYIGDPRVKVVARESLYGTYVMPDGRSRWAGEDCVVKGDADVGKTIQVSACTLGDFTTATRRVLVIGNSFAPSFVQSFDDLVVSNNYAVTVIYSLLASPVPEIQTSQVMRRANDHYWSSVVPSFVDQLKAGDWVFLIARLTAFSLIDESGGADDALEKFSSGLANLADRLSQRGIRLAVMNGLPLPGNGQCEPAFAVPQWFAPFGPACRFLSRDVTLWQRSKVDAILSALERGGTIRKVDLMDIFCWDTSCTFEARDGQILYRDQQHPSVEAARLSAPIIRSVLMSK